MKEILFRGKDDESGNFVYGLVSLERDCRNPKMLCKIKPCIVWEESGLLHSSFVSPETVGQYTGLTDKNGTKIFEGDIVNVNTKPDSLCNNYRGKHLVIRFDEFHRFIASGKLQYPLCEHYEWEVIGNIYDNPEFAKGD